MQDSTKVTTNRTGKEPHAALATTAFLLPLLLAGAYLNMGQSSCGGGPRPVLYPDHVSIDVPILRVDALGSGEREEPYFISFNWEATSLRGLTPVNPYGTASYEFKGSNSGPWPVRQEARRGEQILLGEDISNAVFDFPDVPQNATEALTSHVKIAGLTMCAIEKDDAGGQSAFKSDIERFATQLRAGLSAVYTREPFKDASANAALRQVVVGLLAEAEATWASFTPQQKQQHTPLYETILTQLGNAITMIDTGTKAFAPKIGASAILGIVGSVLQALPNIISLFKKKHNPDPDDFVGCASIVYVGVPFSVWNAMEASGTSTCSAGSGGAVEIAVCAINQDGPTTLRFAPAMDAENPEVSRRWLANVDVRRGLYRTSGDDVNVLASTGHRHVVVNAGSTLTFNMPQPAERPYGAGPYPPCVEGVQQKCNVQFAHTVDYQTDWADWLSYEILEKPDGRREVKVAGSSGHANIGVRLSTATVPSYIKIKRDVIDLISETQLNYYIPDTQYSSYPTGYENSQKVVVIPEVLKIWQSGHSTGINLRIKKTQSGGNAYTEIYLDQPRTGDPRYGNVQARVQLTYLYWDSSTVDVHEGVVYSDDDETTPPEEPQYTEIEWAPPSVPQHLSTTLYFPTELWSGNDWDTGFSIRATGTEVTDNVMGRARIYAQDYYTNSLAYTKAKLVNLRFK